MAKSNLFDVILNTITDVQQKNQADPNEETAHPNVFDLIKSKISQVDQNMKDKRAEKGKKPISILDMIKNQIETAKNQNRADPNTPTAPDSLFDRLIKQVDPKPRQLADDGIKEIIQEYNLDVSRLSAQTLQQIQQQYEQDLRTMKEKYAQAIYDLTQR